MNISGVVFAALLVSVACSGADDTASAGSDESSTTELAVTSTDPTTSATASLTTVASTSTLAETVPETSTSTTPSTHLIETVLGDAVRAYFDAREAANAGPAPNPSDPALAEVSASPELERLVQSIQEKADAGQAIRAGEQDLAEIRVGFVEHADDSASAAVCSIDDGVIYVVETGEIVNDDVVTHNYRVDLVLIGEVWKVAEIVRVQQWEGVSGCALAAGDYPY